VLGAHALNGINTTFERSGIQGQVGEQKEQANALFNRPVGVGGRIFKPKKKKLSKPHALALPCNEQSRTHVRLKGWLFEADSRQIPTQEIIFLWLARNKRTF
jgi:hypothetical protein